MKKLDLLAYVMIGIALTMTAVGLFMLAGAIGRGGEMEQTTEEYVSSMPTLAAVAHGNDLVMTVPENITYIYEPKPDITAHEVALILPIFIGISCISGYGISHLEDLPPEAKRHFRREPPEKED